MSTARTAGSDAPADELAAAVRDARFVRVLSRSDGAALAASGVLARACRDLSIPFQVRAVADPDPTAVAGDDALTVTVGAPGGDRCLLGDARPASVTAAAAARALDATVDPALALAGVVAAGRAPSEAGVLLEQATGTGAVERRPGVGVPTDDLADGLAHSTLVHASFSGDPAAARAALDGLDLPSPPDDDARRRVASLVALDAAGAPDASDRSAAAVERVLRPYATPDGPFATLAGYADVLDAVARERPGTGVALALGHDAHESALAAWRDHGAAAHALVRDAEFARYEGVLVGRIERAETPPAPTARLSTAARLVRDFRSPEPVALLVDRGRAAAASVDPVDVGAAMRRAVAVVRSERPAEDGRDADATRDSDADATEGTDGTETVGYGDETRGEARFARDTRDTNSTQTTQTTFVDAFREAL